MAWTDERVDLLRKLWMDGLSASQIAAELGGVTRNAVIGKIHRLGLSGRANRASSPNARRKPAASRANGASKAAKGPSSAKASNPSPTPKPAPVVPDVEKPEMLMLSLLQLTEQTCKFPIGDPQEEGFAFCGVKARDGDPYCEYHCRITYQPAADRRNKASRSGGSRPASGSSGYSAF